MGWFDQIGSTSSLNNMLVGDLNTMKAGIGEKVADFISLFVKTIGCVIFALVTGWKLTLVFLAASSPLIIFAFNLTLKVLDA